jgi:hypothetical protein
MTGGEYNTSRSYIPSPVYSASDVRRRFVTGNQNQVFKLERRLCFPCILEPSSMISEHTSPKWCVVQNVVSRHVVACDKDRTVAPPEVEG